MRPEKHRGNQEIHDIHEIRSKGSIELRKSGKRQNWKNGVVEVGEKKWSLEAENGLPEFFVG